MNQPDKNDNNYDRLENKNSLQLAW